MKKLYFIFALVQVISGTIPINGGCVGDYNPLKLCKNTCDIFPVGRDTELNFRWQVKTERTLVGKVTVKNQNAQFANANDPYIGILRFDEKFCSNAVLQEIAKGENLVLDVGDRSLENHFLESVAYPRNIGEKWNRKALFLQFRRSKRDSSNAAGEEISENRERDQFYVIMQILKEGFEQDSLQKCLRKAHLSVLPDDGAQPNSNDYTRCVAFDRYRLPINWRETTTSTSTTTTTTTTTTKSTTTRTTTTSTTNANTFPSSVSQCSANQFFGAQPNTAELTNQGKERILAAEEVAEGSWPFLVRIVAGMFDYGGFEVEKNRGKSGMDGVHVGVIISDRYVLTSAELCMWVHGREGVSMDSMYVLTSHHSSLQNQFPGYEMTYNDDFGTGNSGPISENQRMYKVLSGEFHDDYNWLYPDYDWFYWWLIPDGYTSYYPAGHLGPMKDKMCLLRTKRMDLTLPGVSVACVANEQYPPPEAPCYIASWGYTGRDVDDGQIDGVDYDYGLLSSKSVQLVDHLDHCKWDEKYISSDYWNDYSEAGKEGYPEHHICISGAASPEHDSDTKAPRVEDKGAPLVCIVDNRPVVYGIVNKFFRHEESWGKAVVDPVGLKATQDWIRNNVNA